MLLAEITHQHNDTSGNKLAEQCIHVQQFHKQFKQQVIEYEIETKREKVPNQLYPSTKIGGDKNHEFHQDKPHDKIDHEGNEQGCNMWLEGKETQVEVFFF